MNIDQLNRSEKMLLSLESDFSNSPKDMLNVWFFLNQFLFTECLSNDTKKLYNENVQPLSHRFGILHYTLIKKNILKTF